MGQLLQCAAQQIGFGGAEDQIRGDEQAGQVVAQSRYVAAHHFESVDPGLGIRRDRLVHRHPGFQGQPPGAAQQRHDSQVVADAHQGGAALKW